MKFAPALVRLVHMVKEENRKPTCPVYITEITVIGGRKKSKEGSDTCVITGNRCSFRD